MNPTSTVDFCENRARFTQAELQEYADQWVAFSADGKRVVSSAASLGELFNELRATKVNPQALAFEYIAIDSGEISLGGAEFL